MLSEKYWKGMMKNDVPPLLKQVKKQVEMFRYLSVLMRKV